MIRSSFNVDGSTVLNRLFAGLDVSTQSCKLVVIDFDAGDIVFVGLVNYDEDLPQYGTRNGVIPDSAEGVSESDPRMWLKAMDEVFGKARAGGVSMSDVLSVSVSGQQHGLVALDIEGNLTRNTSKLWNDFSTREECAVLTEMVGGLEPMVEEVGNSQRTGYTAPKIFHMARNEPEAFRKTATFFLVHNYINYYLTGGVRVMEPGDTSGMALWNPATRGWSKRVLEAIHPDLAMKLPEVLDSDHSIGHISADLVERFGFSPECTVDAGCGDNMYGAVGTGNVEPGLITVSLGSSGTAYTVMNEPFIDPTGEIASFCDSTGNYLPLACVSNLANGYDAVIERFGLSHEEFNRIVGKTEPGNGGRLLIPWYVGERTPDVPQAGPVYFGFGLDDFTPDVLCRAVLEGHVLNLYDGFRRLPVDVNEIRLTGGLSRSEAWCRTIADVFGVETVPVKGEGAAMGAALHAAWVWMKEQGEKIALKDVVTPFVILDESMRKIPDHGSRSVYELEKRLFHALSRRIRGMEAEDPFDLRAKLIGKV